MGALKMDSFFEERAKAVAKRIADRFYTDRVAILHSIETEEFGRKCDEWLPVPNPCDVTSPMDSVPAQFRHDGAEREEQPTVTTHTYKATVDLPEVYDWLTLMMRIEYEGLVYRILTIQPDSGAFTRLKLEKVIV